MLAIPLPKDIEKRLNHLAEQTGRTKTFYAQEAILRYLEDIEDVYLAEQRLEALQNGQSATRSLKEVRKSLGLEG